MACGEGQIGVETLNRFSAPRLTYRLACAYDDVTRTLCGDMRSVESSIF